MPTNTSYCISFSIVLTVDAQEAEERATKSKKKLSKRARTVLLYVCLCVHVCLVPYNPLLTSPAFLEFKWNEKR